MLIKEISLYNFRQFSGKHTISFATDPEKNITMVMGDNGSGKTTLAQAFQWALYGKTEFKIKELINRDVRDGMDPGDVYEVRVDLYIVQDGDTYQIRRRQKVLRENSAFKAQNPSFTIAKKNDSTGEWDYMDEWKAQAFIKRMLPEELSKYFFFDGERIRNMSEEIEKGKSREFAMAVKNLVGLTAMIKAIERMKPSVTTATVLGKIDHQIDERGNYELQKVNAEIRKKTGSKEPIEKRIDEIENLPDQYNAQAAEINQNILALSSAVEQKKQYENLKSEIDKLERKKLEDINQIFKTFSRSIGDFFAQPLTKDSLEILRSSQSLDSGIPALHIDTIKYLLERGYCLCGQPLNEKHAAAKESVEKLKDSALPKTIGQSIGQYSDNCRSRTKMGQTFISTLDAQFSNYRYDVNQIAIKSNKADDLYAQLSDTSQAEKLKADYAQVKANAQKYNNELIKLTAELRTIEKELNSLNQKKETLLLVDKNNKEAIQLRAYAKYVYEWIKEDFDKKERTTRKKLEQTINQIFEEIYDGGITLTIDEKYNLKVTVTDTSAATGDGLERNTAQNYAIIFAFIAGIIRLAKEKNESYRENDEDADADVINNYPLVMDAPLSAFDTKRIKNICATLPNVADQIIIFIKDTDGVIAEQHMGNRIGERWLLTAKSQTESIVEKR